MVGNSGEETKSPINLGLLENLLLIHKFTSKIPNFVRNLKLSIEKLQLPDLPLPPLSQFTTWLYPTTR